METIGLVDYGVARFVLPGETESGDSHLISVHDEGILLAVVDGLGHGRLAANAARIAGDLLEMNSGEPIITLVEKCHELLKHSRGVVMSLASFDLRHNLMTWLGIGNVQGVLIRSAARNCNVRESLLLRGGVVGASLPPLQAAVVPISEGDTLIFSTDGIRNGFEETLSGRENPQKAANRILESYRKGDDDALVLVARLTGSLT